MVRDVILAMLAGLPLALAFAWLGGQWVASLAVAPVEEMTVAAERVTAERLDQRVPVPAVRDEIQDLACVLNATLDRLELSYHQALRFSADASHELKTPLTVMRASIEALLDSPSLGEDGRAAVAGLLEQTHRLSNITASLLLLSRADAGRLTLDLSDKDIAVITEACAEDARIVAERSGVAVECTLPEHAPARVDALRFAQITSNLLDNAVKYNLPGGSVRVKLADDGAIWRIVIGNSGPAIKPENRPQLFDRFFRADHTSELPGHGLGLSLARELARAHGGDVTLVRSEEGWTEFAATIPKSGPNGAN
jgi:signal transduction histidine kinase